MTNGMRDLIYSLTDEKMAEADIDIGPVVESASRQGNLPSFESIVEELNTLQRQKMQDYGSDTDPLANIRASEEFGIPAWLTAVTRANEKVTRIKSYTRNGRLANEGMDDTLLDLANYAIHALRLWREAQCDD